MPRQELHEDNRLAWNAATAAHNSHKADQAAFLRTGGSTLFPEELVLLGDIDGRTLVHLQCNAGQDSLCLARLGATVTGVDISDEAISFARGLAVDTGIPATFTRADIYDWLAAAATGHERWDIVFSSYGVLPWLSDLRAWGAGIAAILKPGGRFVFLDFHPVVQMFDWDWERTLPYFADGAVSTEDHGISDYVATAGEALAPSGYLDGEQGFVNPHPGHQFHWTVGAATTALLNAGLVITGYREYPYMNGAQLRNDMRETPGKRMIPPDGVPNLPLMLGLVAERR